MAQDITSSDFGKVLLKSMESHLNKKYEEFIDEEIEALAKKVRSKMKSEQDRVVLHMLDHFSMERIGRDLRITVKHIYEKPDGSH